MPPSWWFGIIHPTNLSCLDRLPAVRQSVVKADYRIAPCIVKIYLTLTQYDYTTWEKDHVV